MQLDSKINIELKIELQEYQTTLNKTGMIKINRLCIQFRLQGYKGITKFHFSFSQTT